MEKRPDEFLKRFNELLKIDELEFSRNISSWDFTKDDVYEVRKRYLEVCERLKQRGWECYTGQEYESSGLPISFGRNDRVKDGPDRKFAPFVAKNKNHTKPDERRFQPERYIDTKNNNFIEIVQFHIKLHSESIKYAWECFNKGYDIEFVVKSMKKRGLTLPYRELLDISEDHENKRRAWAGGRYFFIFGEKGSISYKLSKYSNGRLIEILHWDLTKIVAHENLKSDDRLIERFKIWKSTST